MRRRVGTTDDRGTTEIRGLEIPGTALAVGSDAFAVTRLESDELAIRIEELRAEEAAPELVVTLREGGTVIASVRDDAGRPVEGARVSVESVSVSAATRWRRMEETTDTEGHARLTPISQSRVEVRVWDLILGVTRSDPIDVSPGEVTEVTVTYEAHASVEGRVLLNGEPAPDGEVYFGGVSQSGDFMPVSGGRFSGRVRRSRTALLHYVRRDPRVVVQFDREPAVGDEEIVLDYPGADLEVVIAKPSSDSDASFRVRVVAVDGALHSATARSVTDRVVFPGLPLGLYQIVVHAEGEPLGHLESPVVDFVEDRLVSIGYRETVPLSFPQTVAPIDVRAWAYPDDGAREAVTLLRRFPLELAWPRGVTGWLVLEARGLPPKFTRVDVGGARADGFAFEPGGTLLPIHGSFVGDWSYRVTPVPMLGPPAFWDRLRRVGVPIALAAGSYRLGWSKDGSLVRSETVEVPGLGVTEIRAGD
ncbi:MAG: hypothetical protein AAF488_04395 [Planctomycetota bacterium]